MIHVTVPRIQPHPATKAEAVAILTAQREDAKAVRAKLPEWRRYFDDLVEFIPDADVKEARSVLVPLLNAMGRAAILDARKFSSECFSAMDAEVGK
jgi:hypothetical protein